MEKRKEPKIASPSNQSSPRTPSSPRVHGKSAAASGKFASFGTRALWTFILLAGFCTTIYMGHIPLVMLVFLIQFHMVKELFALARQSQDERQLPGFRLQQWYFFFVTCFYFYLRFIKNSLAVEVTSNAVAARYFRWLLLRHAFLSYALYTAGIVWFVLRLEKGWYGYQFRQFAWTHMILVVVVGPSSCFVFQIFHGLIWFLLPSCLIIANDIFAYLAGIMFGRTPLIKLSPKKTWEGFVGALLGTLVLAYVLADVLQRFSWMTCPRRDLSFGPLTCEEHELYTKQTFTVNDAVGLMPHSVVEAASSLVQVVPQSIRDAAQHARLHASPMQLHAMVLACFASIIAPFGGFFASGFKRAFKLKDFGHTIPGHGGITDRFDCQMMMAAFSYMYYYSYIMESNASVGDVLSTVLTFSAAQQLELFLRLGNLLAGAGLLPEEQMATLSNTIASANKTAAS